jgi:hypothetical protein
MYYRQCRHENPKTIVPTPTTSDTAVRFHLGIIRLAMPNDNNLCHGEAVGSA